jgi:DNA-binding LacI/PurR family transcriptional regulator
MITMQDIADKAGVSKGTVSYVLNGKQKKARINRETCAKVIAIAEALGYRRNAIAQSMKTGKTNVIGFVGGLFSSYCMEIVEGINKASSQNNYLLKLLSTNNIDEVKKAARQCVEQRLDGVICMSLTEEGLDTFRKELCPHNIPVVLVDSSFSHDWCSRVISNDFAGAKMATEYLLSLGHRRIMHLTNDLSHGFSKERYDGFSAAMEDAGEIEQEDICIIDDNLELTESIRTVVREALLSKKPSAVFCGSDPIAMKLIIVASELGLNVPDDLSIIGYAGLDFSVISNPPLTTVRQDFPKMGNKAAKILFEEINGCQEKKQIELPVELITRNSTNKYSPNKNN